MSSAKPAIHVDDHTKLVAVGAGILISPFVHSLLVMLSEHAPVLSPIGAVTILLGLLLWFTDDD